MLAANIFRPSSPPSKNGFLAGENCFMGASPRKSPHASVRGCRRRALAHDPEKGAPVFRKDHAQTRRYSGMTIRGKSSRSRSHGLAARALQTSRPRRGHRQSGVALRAAMRRGRPQVISYRYARAFRRRLPSPRLRFPPGNAAGNRTFDGRGSWANVRQCRGRHRHP